MVVIVVTGGRGQVGGSGRTDGRPPGHAAARPSVPTFFFPVHKARLLAVTRLPPDIPAPMSASVAAAARHTLVFAYKHMLSLSIHCHD